MRKVFTGLFVGVLVLVFCCPAFATEGSCGVTSPQNADMAAACPPDMNADSGLTWYQVAGVLALLGGGGALGWTGCRKMQAIRVEPQPLEVKRIAECATRKELDDFKTEVREDFRRVHQRIDNSVEDIAEIKGEMKRLAINQEKILDILLHSHDNK